jgi:molybdate transport system ATP-binding protein
VVIGGGDATLDTVDSPEGEVFIAFAPSSVALYRTRPDGSPRNLWRARVAAVERHGDRARVQLSGPPFDAVADVTPAAVAELELSEGSMIWAAVKATETHVYPA